MLSCGSDHPQLCLFIFHSDDLVRVLEKCDQAIARAVRLRKKRNHVPDQLFDSAKRALHDYCLEFHHR